MYCVVHGSVDVDFRTKSVEYLTSLLFDGYAIGGSLGEYTDELLTLLDEMMPMFEKYQRRNKPRHLLGVADKKNIMGAVQNGIDTLDSCYPTRISRHGALLTRKGKLHIKSGKHSKSYGVPIDSGSVSALHVNTMTAKETLFMQFAAVHNIQYMNDLMASERQKNLNGEI